MRISKSVSALAVLAFLAMPAMALNADEPGMATDQKSVISSWPPDKQAEYQLWPADTKAYYWTLAPDRQKLFWGLTDADKVTLSGMTQAERIQAWERIEARGPAPRQPG